MGQGGEGIHFFRGKVQEGGACLAAGAGALGTRVAAVPHQIRALNGFHPDRGAWHGSDEALGKTLVRLLEKGGGKKTIRWHAFRRLGAAQLKHMGAPMPTILLWGGWKTPGVARMYTEAPPSWKFVRTGETPWPVWGGGQMEKRPGIWSRRAALSPSGPPGSEPRSPMCRAKVHDILGAGMRQPGLATGSGAGQHPPLPEGGGGGAPVSGGGGGRPARRQVTQARDGQKNDRRDG